LFRVQGAGSVFRIQVGFKNQGSGFSLVGKSPPLLLVHTCSRASSEWGGVSCVAI
jgi:hypothetical protein